MLDRYEPNDEQGLGWFIYGLGITSSHTPALKEPIMSPITFVLMLGAVACMGCSTPPRIEAGTMPPDKQVLLVLVGGNSETIFRNGIKKMYGGRGNWHASPLAQMLEKSAGLDPRKVSPFYFSWTGDDEDDESVLPGHWG